jgi:hypothetical protein
MSILKKAYEISVWKDSVDNGSISEEKLGIIGTNTMIA